MPCSRFTDGPGIFMLTRFAVLVTCVALASVLLGGCTLLPVSRAPAAEGYATRPSPHGAAPFPNWPVPPDEVERLILHARPELRQETGAGAGTTGAGFGGLFYNWFVPNWNSIRVPALRSESIDRLRLLKPADVTSALGVVSQLELDDQGIYRNVPPGENLAPGPDRRRGRR